MPFKHFTVSNIILVFSALLFCMAIYVFYVSYLTSSWPSTIGEFAHLETHRLGATIGPKSPVMSADVNGVIYIYTVNGISYYGHAPVSRKDVDIEAKTIEVFYNPDKPVQSVLYKGINWPHFVGLSTIGFLFAYAAYAWKKP
mgnify:CR=1 FL=1